MHDRKLSPDGKFPLIRWQEALFKGNFCGMWPLTPEGTVFSELNCGTKKFCNAYNNQTQLRNNVHSTRLEYSSAKECFDDHESKPTKQAWKSTFANGVWCIKQPKNNEESYGFTEEWCGTYEYCNYFDELDDMKKKLNITQPEFASSKDCFSHRCCAESHKNFARRTERCDLCKGVVA